MTSEIKSGADDGGKPSVAVVIPCYGCRAQIMSVLGRIGPEVDQVIVVDDKCPEETGQFVKAECDDPRVRVTFHSQNQGVGGAVITGYREAVESGANIVVKIDGDGQMDPQFVNRLIFPILTGEADYTKGNRFHSIEDVKQMPLVRLLGNSMLSFGSKFSSGYWDLFDPTNGFTAIHSGIIQFLPLEKLSQRYFFESDLLFRLNTIRAKVIDVPMRSHYGSEVSRLKIPSIIPEFAYKHLGCGLKRIAYNHFLRNFSVASLELVIGFLLLSLGVSVGLYYWTYGYLQGVEATAGTVMLAALPVILGSQLVLSFLSFDMTMLPSQALQRKLARTSHGFSSRTAGDAVRPIRAAGAGGRSN